MKRIGFLQAACTLTIALLLAACSQDDFSGGQDEPLPEGKYPLKISSVSISAESSSEPWDANAPHTRVLWKDSIIVKWSDGDLIGVQIPGSEKTGEYRVKVDQSRNVTGLEAVNEVYWESRERVRVKGWYPADTVNDIPLTNQVKDQRNLAYVLYGETDEDVNYQTGGDQVHLVFSHQLSKIRVKLLGTGTIQVEKLSINTYPSCKIRPNGERKVIGSGTPKHIPMVRVNYDYVSNYQELHVVPGYEIREVFLKGVFQKEIPVELSSPITPVAGKTHVIYLQCDTP